MLAVCGIAHGDPPSPQAQDALHVAQRHEALRRGELTEWQYERELRGIAAQLDFDQLQIDDFVGLRTGWFFDITRTNAKAITRLKVLTRRRDAAGMRAACTAAAIIGRDHWRDPDLITLFRAPLVHPGWHPDADPDSIGLEALTWFLRFRLEEMFVPFLLPELETVAQMLVNDARRGASEACERLVRVLSRVRSVGQHPNLVRYCEMARLKALNAAMEDSSYSESPSARQNAIEFLSSSMARLEFFDRAAPPLTARWSSEANVRTLADGIGKVVVLEFWSVTCGPCVGNIPNMERLRQEFAGKQVLFIAATGAVQEDLSEPRDPSDQQVEVAARELTEFMAAREMSGPVWVTSAGAFEPLYGVQSIPHIVILDARGRVRASGLHPGLPDEIRREIDMAGKPLPGDP